MREVANVKREPMCGVPKWNATWGETSAVYLSFSFLADGFTRNQTLTCVVNCIREVVNLGSLTVMGSRLTPGAKATNLQY